MAKIQVENFPKEVKTFINNKNAGTMHAQSKKKHSFSMKKFPFQKTAPVRTEKIIFGGY